MKFRHFSSSHVARFSGLIGNEISYSLFMRGTVMEIFIRGEGGGERCLSVWDVFERMVGRWNDNIY